MSGQRIDALDLSVFDHIHSQTTTGDKRALLALQSATARHVGEYSYLEIGSHLGGSIQPHLVDARCRTIYSIDLRPLEQPDARGVSFAYPDNSTARMLDNLSRIDATAVGKITTFDCDAGEVATSSIVDAPHLCFIDGEHTTRAAMRDFFFCKSVAREDATICFHDADVIYRALDEIVRRLGEEKVGFYPMMLDGTVFAIHMGASRLSTDSRLADQSRSWRRYVFWARLRMRARGLLGGKAKSLLRPLARPIVRYLRGS